MATFLWRRKEEEERINDEIECDLTLLQGDIKSSMKRNSRTSPRASPQTSSSPTGYMRGGGFRDCLPLKGIMTIFCLIFRWRSREKKGDEVKCLSPSYTGEEKKKKKERRAQGLIRDARDQVARYTGGNDEWRSPILRMSGRFLFLETSRENGSVLQLGQPASLIAS